MATAAQLLDELMGKDRNLVPGEKSAQVHWSHLDCCKHFICGFCPHDLFVNTKADLGLCSKVHDDQLKLDYEKSSRFGKMGYEEEYLLFLTQIQSDVERKIRRGHDRLQMNKAREQELSQNDSDKTKMLTDHINQLLEEIEQLGSEGKVEEAQGVAKLVDQLKEEKEQGKANAGVAGQEKQMEVCEVCGAFLIVGDAQSRVDDHLQGKQHVGYAKIKSTIEELKKKPWLKRKKSDSEQKEQKESNEKERTERRRSRDRSREKSRRSRSRSKEHRRERRRSRDRSDRDRSDRDRSDRDRSERDRSDRDRSDRDRKDRDRSDRDRSDRDRDRDRRSSRDSRRSYRSRSKSRDKSSRRRSRSRDRSSRRSSRNSSRDRRERRSSREKREGESDSRRSKEKSETKEPEETSKTEETEEASKMETDDTGESNNIPNGNDEASCEADSTVENSVESSNNTDGQTRDVDSPAKDDLPKEEEVETEN